MNDQAQTDVTRAAAKAGGPLRLSRDDNFQLFFDALRANKDFLPLGVAATD
jgi:hypothetical protein